MDFSSIKSGCFRVGNSGYDEEYHLIQPHGAGLVGHLSKSRGTLDELNNILLLVANGTYEGNAIGGDRYPGSAFIDHLLHYKADPDCKMLVLSEAVKTIKKPTIAWAIGACAKIFATELRFGNSGSIASLQLEIADLKNAAMKAVGLIIPDTFKDLPTVLKQTYYALIAQKIIKVVVEKEPSIILMDYK
ncbi:citrate synthase [Tulasnella sp. 330]|nr:citrate synthase [Tulasnella sp. 330]KAG8879621.1 citrate synthase [Tulasnella sp. 331]KAG8889348.1 citrate synthase [Tulasnella sp. 332]